MSYKTFANFIILAVIPKYRNILQLFKLACKPNNRVILANILIFCSLSDILLLEVLKVLDFVSLQPQYIFSSSKAVIITGWDDYSWPLAAVIFRLFAFADRIEAVLFQLSITDLLFVQNLS